METTYTAYDYKESVDRINEILNSSDNDYQDKDSIPARTDLTYTNGFYTKCSVMFVDIRGSSGLSEQHTRPVLAKIYRTFISESISVMRYNSQVREINIEGDCVWGAFNTTEKKHIDEVFSDAARLSSMLNILNWRLEKKGYSMLRAGIGISWGTALMIKAGAKNSGINEIVYMGTVVSEAANLCSLGQRSAMSYRTYVSNDFRLNLNDHNQNLLTRDNINDCYAGNVVNTAMEEWLKQQRSQ